jgi:hypothetical protein
MVAITLKLYESPSTPTAESEEFTFQIDYIARKNFLLSSSCSCPFKSNSDDGIYDLYTNLTIFESILK